MARGETPVATPVPLSLAESLTPREKERVADKQPDVDGTCTFVRRDIEIQLRTKQLPRRVV
ncbi:MAG: hypothetical protein GY946_11720 [bacterium]|nr:hypothetical protein [bacterium]